MRKRGVLGTLRRTLLRKEGADTGAKYCSKITEDEGRKGTMGFGKMKAVRNLCKSHFCGLWEQNAVRVD